MRVFLTGGTGFIGHHVLELLRERDWRVVACHRNPSVAPQKSDGVNWIYRPLDKITPDDLRGCDAVIHLAATGVSPRRASWDELMHWNVAVPVKIAQCANEAGVKRVVVAGSFAEYGRTADLYDRIPATAALLPTFPYAASKAAASVALHGAAVDMGLELVYLRIFSAFGEGQNGVNLWPALRHAALSGADFPLTPGEQLRDFVDVGDVARWFADACQTGRVGTSAPLIANVGSGRAITVREFAETWWSKFGGRGRLLVGAVPYRANEIMKYVPEVSPL